MKTTLPTRLLCLWLAFALAAPLGAHAEATPAATVRTPASASEALDKPLGNFDLRDVKINEALRLIAELSGANVVATRGVGDKEVSLYLRNATARGVIDTIARVTGLWYRYLTESQTFIMMSADEYQRDISVFREEETRTLHLKHHNVVAAANAIQALFGSRVRLSRPVEERLGEEMKTTDLRRGGSGTAGSGRNGGGKTDAAGSSAVAAGNRTGSAGNPSTLRPDQQATTAARLAEQAGQLSLEEVQSLRQGTEPPIHVTYNRLHNLLIVRSGDEKAMKQVADLVQSIDLPTRQVLLEMRIVQVTLDDEFRRAFDVDLFSGGSTSGGPGSQAPNPLRPSATTSPNAVAALGNHALDSASTGIFQFINSRIRARLQLLEEKGKVQTLARPMVLASNNEPARLFIGEEVVLITGASSQTTTGVNSPSTTNITTETETRDIGTTLVVHPRINDDRTVTLTIDQEISRRIQGGTTIPLAIGSDQILDYPIDTVETSNIQVAALAKDALTIAVGGLIRAETNKRREQIPGFGDLPVVGNLFAHDVNTDERSEMILLVTPHILDTAEDGAAVTQAQMSPAVEAQNDRLDPRPQARDTDALAPASRPEAPSQHTAADDATARYVRLTRHALLAQHAPDEAARRDPTIGARSVPASTPPLWPDLRLATSALGAWQDGDLHATVLRLENRSLKPMEVDLAQLRGRWLAATVERRTLTPWDTRDSTATLVLISDRPYAEALEENRP